MAGVNTTGSMVTIVFRIKHIWSCPLHCFKCWLHIIRHCPLEGNARLLLMRMQYTLIVVSSNPRWNTHGCQNENGYCTVHLIICEIQCWSNIETYDFTLSTFTLFKNVVWTFNSLRSSHAYMRQLITPLLVQILDQCCNIFFMGTKFSDILIEIHIFAFSKMHLKLSGNSRPFISASMC